MENIITSTNNAIIKEARSLQEKKYRKELQKFLVDGEKLVNEVVIRKLPIDRIFVAESKLEDYSKILSNFDGKVMVVSDNVFKTISENNTPQGIIAELFLNFNQTKLDANSHELLVLDRIQDPGNLGTIIRTAIATGFNNIILIDCVDPYSPKVVRSSSGGVLSVNLYQMSEEETIKFCNENSFQLLTADMNGENIFNFNNIYKKFALVIGNEGQGVSKSFKNLSKIISLPMKRGIESLNAGVSASVLMYFLNGKNI